ncbi:MAG: hypothetical protein Q7R30_10985 [Acidobacteriota bacterium]|nr:hypothetical protein [Acidobacteriota bacterium]
MTRWLVLSGTTWLFALALASAQPGRPAFPGMLDQHPAIEYRGTAAADEVTRVAVSGLAFDGKLGYLRSVLAALDIPIESQVLLFSKTGIQHQFTNPQDPRALYFNDRVIVGYIPNAPFLEVASHDPRQGVIFYLLKQEPAAPPSFARAPVCLSCHLTGNTLDVPGLLVRSMFTGPEGRTMPQLGSFVVDHRNPLEQRWGGWYVTGTHGAARHMGNSMVTDLSHPETAIGDATLNRTALDSRVDATLYPSASSDIVALMVFDHQGRAVNLFTLLGWQSRIAKAESRLGFSTGELRDLVRETADYLLFVEEAPLAAPIQGTSGFGKTFTAAGRRDSRNRSLRELDLQTRLLKYRCSHMIYSPAFEALSGEARAAVMSRMKQILDGRADGAVVQEILGDTLSGWR